MSGPLKGLRVLSFGRALSGPYAAMILNDLGAEVIKVEAAGFGDFTRMAGPFIKDVSSYFLSINRGKKSLTVNLKDDRGRDIIFGLVKHVDVLLENFRPGVMARMGLDFETVRTHNPRLVYASISGFGQTGPYAQRAAFDMIAQGMGGVVGITGEPGRAPVRVGYSMGDMGGSLFGVIGILAALSEREKSGQGQWLDVSMVDAQVALCENACARYFATGQNPGPLGSRHPLFTPFQIFPTRDGHIVLIVMRDEQWKGFCEAADRPEWIADERFNSNNARLENYDLFLEHMNELMGARTTKDWMERFDARGVMCGPVNTIEDVVNDPHIQERGMFPEVEHPRLGPLKVVGTPMKFSRTPCVIDRAEPGLGEHADAVLADLLGLSEEEIRALREAGTI